MIDETALLARMNQMEVRIKQVQERTKDPRAKVQCGSHLTMLEEIRHEIHKAQLAEQQKGKKGASDSQEVPQHEVRPGPEL